MRGIVFVGIACGLLCGASAARADYAFSGSGSSGTLVNSGQTWQIKPATTSTLASWSSSPFVYDEPDEAFAIKLTFSFTGQGTLDNEALAVGETSGCNGNPGATVFCGLSDNATSQWTTDYSPTLDPNTIEFITSEPSQYVTPSGTYDVMVYFDGAAPTSFTGQWFTTSFTETPAPEPSTWVMLGFGFAALGLLRLRRAGVFGEASRADVTVAQ